MLLMQQQELSGGVLPEPNTFIGAGGVTSEADLASKTSLSESNISNFNIDSHGNIWCYINTSYTITSTMHNTRYYIDLDGLCSGINVNECFRDSIQNKVMIFPNVDNINFSAFRGAASFNRNQYDIVSVPNSIPLGSTDGSDGLLSNSNLENLYTDISNATNNGGSPDGDITNATATITNINYATNSTPPNSVNDLAVSATYGTVLTLSWAAPTSTNAIDYYLIFVNNAYYSLTSSTSFDIIGLSLNTSYEIKIITLDEMGNISDFSNSVTQTTLSDYQIPTGNIISYWNFDSNSNDQVGSNDGTDTSVTYTSGYISNSATFNGSSSHIQIPYSSDLQFGSVGGDLPFSISLVAKTSSTSDQMIINDLTIGSRKFFLYYVGQKIMFRLDTGTGTNYIQVVTDNNIDLTSFTSIVATYDGSESETGLSLTINGIVVSQTQSQTGTYTGMPVSTTNIEIGKHGDPSTSSVYWNGQIDETSIFDIALTQGQASDIYAKNQAGLYLTE